MTERGRGGEPAGARLLELARRELLESLLPQLQGAARYRARLVANAMKIAASELQSGPADRAAVAHRLRGLAAAALPGGADVAVLDDAEVAAALCAALRAGRLDGQRELHDLLVKLTADRCATLS